MFLIRVSVIAAVLGLFCFGYAGDAMAQNDRNQAPVHYDDSTPTDSVGQLMKELNQESSELTWNEKFGWLPSLLDRLSVPKSSQTLVFSKTSQQHRKIRPSSPRAIYYSDDVYVGYVQNGDFLEIASVDPSLGAVFYTLNQEQADRPILKRDTGQCLACHDNHKTQNVPGFLIRSVYPQRSGYPQLNLGTTSTDHSTSFEDRFGGWYVTGTHGSMQHRGNALLDSQTKMLDKQTGGNQVELPRAVRGGAYLEDTSDIVALMLMEHQVQFHNYVSQATYVHRRAVYRDHNMNKILGRPEGFQSDISKRQIDAAASELVAYLLFSEEFELTSPVKGNSRFAEEFGEKGIRTRDGRSLRDLDLKNRLLKYPCSYLIYTNSFNSIPSPVLELVKSKILDVLTGRDKADDFAHLSSNDRKNILEILEETHPLFQSKRELEKENSSDRP